MNPESLSISRPDRRIGAILALVVLAWCAAVLLGSVASAAIGAASATPDDRRLLAPFRWQPVAADLA